MDRFQLLNKIDAFQRRHKITDYALGVMAARDGHLIRRLRDGTISDPRISTVKKITDAIDNYEIEAAE